MRYGVTNPQDSPALSVSHITISAGRMTCQVKVRAGFPKYTTPQFMTSVLNTYPTVSYHVCVNERGTRFEHVMNNTSVPHVLEHLIIDIQVNKRATGKKSLVGVTEWTNETAGEAVVSVSFADDLCAVAALNEALAFLNSVLTCGESMR